MPVGIVHSNTSPQSFLRLERDVIIFPLAAVANYFSSATDGGANGNFSLSGAAVGTTVFLSVGGKKPLTNGRLVTATITDAAGGDLTLTLRVVGKRFGRLVSQDFVLAAGGTALIAGTTTMDEVTSATIVAATNLASSDTIAIGFDATRLGLSKPIRNLRDVKFVQKVSSNTPSSAAADIVFGSTLQTTANIGINHSSLNMNAIFSGNVAVTDIYIVEYLVRGDEFSPYGRKFG